MLVAQRQQGEKFSLAEEWSKQQLLQLRKQEDFFCPICKQPVQLKLGEKKRYHFAHYRRDECLEDLENESAYHMDGKIKLYKWLQRQGISVQLEAYLPNIKQRPDLLFTYKEKSIAIEYQCSTISSSLFQKRTESYQKANVHVIWILGGKCLKRKKSHTFHITPFQELFITNHHHYELLSYCPITNTFLKLGSTMYSFSAQTAISHLHTYSTQNFTLPMLFREESTLIYSIHREWCIKKKKWRMYLPSVYDKQVQFFLQKMYEAEIKYFPAEVGVPTPSSFALRTSPILWQGSLFLSILHPMKIDECCTIASLCNYMNKLFHQGLLSFRQLLFYQDEEYSFVIKEYMEFLVLGNCFQIIEEGLYKKQKDFHIPRTVEEACSLDYETTLLALRQQRRI